MTVSTLPPKPVAAVLEKLGRYSRSGAQWKARCPAHDDSTESLMVKEGRDGRALLHCHAGCETEAIVRVLGLTMGDLFPEGSKPERANGARIHAPPSRPAMVRSYDYVDEHGTLLFQACRFHDDATGRKTFRQRRRDGDGWAWNLDGTRLVLYRLPEVIDAAAHERPVYVVEGEKDADALAELGYAATTNPMGAGKWRDEYAEVLRGSSVVILPDNDEPGRAHATAVAGSLHAAGAAVRVVELPNLPPKGDISDWLAGGGDLDTLDRLASQAKPWRPAGPPRKFWRLRELLEDDEIMRPPVPIVPRIAWGGRSTLFAGTDKVGKSTLTGFIAAQVSRGGDFLGQPCQEGVALIVGLEEFVGDAARRMRGFDADGDRVIITDRLPADPLTRPQAIRDLISETTPILVIVDSLITYGEGRVSDASSSAQTGPVVNELTKVAHDTGVALILIHHARKSDGRVRDSSAIPAATDLVLEVSVPDEDTDPTRRRVRARGRVPVHGFEFRYDGRQFALAGPEELPLDQRIVAYVSHHLGCSVRDVREAVVGRNGEKDAVLAQLLADGRIQNLGTAMRSKLWPAGVNHTFTFDPKRHAAGDR